MTGTPPRQGSILDEVATIIKASIKGDPIEPDRVAYAFNEMREKAGTIIHPSSQQSPAYLSAVKWWEDLLEKTIVHPMDEAGGIVRNLLVDEKNEATRTRLTQIIHLLNQAQEDKKSV